MLLMFSKLGQRNRNGSHRSDYISNMDTRVLLEWKICTFYTRSVPCTVNEGHVSGQFLHIVLKAQQNAGQLG